MELKLNKADTFQFNSYSENFVEINNQIIDRNFILFNNVINFIKIESIKELNFSFISNVLNNKPDLILFAFHNISEKPDDKLVIDLYKSNIGYEFMDIKSLCRTYNFLATEDRKVACVVIFNL